MAYELIQNGNAKFFVDWDEVNRINKSFWTSFCLYNSSIVITLSDSHWANPFSYSMPDITHVETDWDLVTKNVARGSENDLKTFKRIATYNVGSVAQQLTDRIRQALHFKKLFMGMQRRANDKSMLSIEKSVDSYMSQIEATKLVRDLSAEGLLIGASVMSGGAAAAAMATGSILKGTAKFQDTGSVAAGALEMGGSFVFGYIKLGRQFTFKQEMVLALIKAPVTTGTELLGGASFSEAALSGALTLTGPSVDKMFSTDLVKKGFQKAAVPITITYRSKKITADFAEKVASGLVQSYAVEKGGSSLISGLSAQEVTAGKASSQSSALETFTLTQKSMLDWAIISQEKGFGKGW